MEYWKSVGEVYRGQRLDLLPELHIEEQDALRGVLTQDAGYESDTMILGRNVGSIKTKKLIMDCIKKYVEFRDKLQTECIL